MQLDPHLLPQITALRQRTKALAMLDAIVCPNWESRYFSYDAKWSKDEEMASMRNGEGDDYFILFNLLGAAIKGLQHESSGAKNGMFAKEIQQQVPTVLASFLNEPAFSMGQASFCYWRLMEDSNWHKVMQPDSNLIDEKDGSLEQLAFLIKPASYYQEFAKDYFEIDLPLDAIESIYALKPLNNVLLESINLEFNFFEVNESALAIDYPLAFNI